MRWQYTLHARTEPCGPSHPGAWHLGLTHGGPYIKPGSSSTCALGTGGGDGVDQELQRQPAERQEVRSAPRPLQESRAETRPRVARPGRIVKEGEA